MNNLTHYCIQEADMKIPAHWIDQSLNVFKIPASDETQAASLVISRDANKGERNLKDYVDSQLEQCKHQLTGFVLKKHEYFRYQERDAGWLEYSWKMDGRELYLRQVFYDRGPQVLICTFTATERDMPYHEATWRQVMSGMVLVPIDNTHSPQDKDTAASNS